MLFGVGDTVYLGDGREGVILGSGPFQDYLVRVLDTGDRSFYYEAEIYKMSLPERVARIESYLGLEK